MVRIISKFFAITVILSKGQTCEGKHIYSAKGQSALLNFPFPCDSTEVTLQQAAGLPFYRSTDRFALLLPQNQENRFNVQNSVEKGNCSLDLTISDVSALDQGTYLSTIYMDGQLLDNLTTRIWLRVDYPPNKASCVEVQDKEGDWVVTDCTALIGNLAGKIECYQDGQKMPSVTDPIEKYSSVTESFLIRKSQPAFCCSSTLDEYKDRCECNDAALNLADDDSNDPCPPSSIITTSPLNSIVTENNQADSTEVFSSTPMNMNERKSKDKLIVHSVLFSLQALLLLGVLVWLRKKTNATRSKTNPEARVAIHV